MISVQSTGQEAHHTMVVVETNIATIIKNSKEYEFLLVVIQGIKSPKLEIVS